MPDSTDAHDSCPNCRCSLYILNSDGSCLETHMKQLRIEIVHLDRFEKRFRDAQPEPPSYSALSPRLKQARWATRLCIHDMIFKKSLDTASLDQALEVLLRLLLPDVSEIPSHIERQFARLVSQSVKRIDHLLRVYYDSKVFGQDHPDDHLCDESSIDNMAVSLAHIGIRLFRHPNITALLMNESDFMTSCFYKPCLEESADFDLVFMSETLLADIIGNRRLPDAITLIPANHVELRNKVARHSAFYTLSYLPSMVWVSHVLEHVRNGTLPKGAAESGDGLNRMHHRCFALVVDCLSTPLTLDARGWPTLFALVRQLPLDLGYKTPQRFIEPIRALRAYSRRRLGFGDPPTTLLLGLMGPSRLPEHTEKIFNIASDSYSSSWLADEIFIDEAPVQNNALLCFLRYWQLHKAFDPLCSGVCRPHIKYFLAHACRIYGLDWVKHGARLSSDSTGYVFPFLYSRMARHESSATYIDFDDFTRLIDKYRTLPPGYRKRYVRMYQGEPMLLFPETRPKVVGCDLPGCEKTGFHGKICSRCRDAVYCDEECQVKAWDDHRKLCLRYEKKQDAIPSDRIDAQEATEGLKNVEGTSQA